MIEEAGRWRSVGWEEAGRRVEELAAGFLALGVRPGDRVAILGRTRLEWTLADFALISTGAVIVPVYPAATPADRAHVLSQSATRMLVCEDAAERERIARLPGLGHLERALTMDGSDDDLAQLSERGRHHLRCDPGAVARAAAAIREEDLLTLVYTSGTTGLPKGCMLTHRNYRAMVDMTRRVDGLAQPGDVVLLHLPLAHVFARLVPFLAADVGMTVAFCPDASRLGVALRAVRPTLLPSVPRVFEAMHTAVLRDLAGARGPRRWLVDAALGAGREAARRRREGRRLDPWLALRLRLADRLVFSRIRSRLGGRVRYAVSGAAKLVPEVAELFEALGVLILEAYGLTECTTAAAINRPDRHRVGTVGPPVPGVELRLAADGEILVRGENVFAGYHLDEAGTREVLDGEGWLRTGDVGSLDAEGFLTITDRTKDIIVTSGGENVPPQRVETALRASPYVSEALVVGDGRPYLVALLSPDLGEIRPAGRTDAEVRRLLGRVVADVNRGGRPRRASAGLRGPAPPAAGRGGRAHADAEGPPARLRGALPRPHRVPIPGRPAEAPVAGHGIGGRSRRGGPAGRSPARLTPFPAGVPQRPTLTAFVPPRTHTQWVCQRSLDCAPWSALGQEGTAIDYQGRGGVGQGEALPSPRITFHPVHTPEGISSRVDFSPGRGNEAPEPRWLRRRRGRPLWRDPGSNWEHHDFQSRPVSATHLADDHLPSGGLDANGADTGSRRGYVAYRQPVVTQPGVKEPRRATCLDERECPRLALVAGIAIAGFRQPQAGL